MKTVKSIIKDNLNKFKDFGYYELLIDTIERNLTTNPDISIESCKSLFEGIAKKVIVELDAAETLVNLEAIKFDALYKKFKTLLCSYCEEEFESKMIDRSGGLVTLINEIRTKRGDISHGKFSPKEFCSSAEFAASVALITEGLVLLILNNFYKIELSYSQVMEYDDFEDYNNYLDSLYEVGSISYSRALYEQEYDTYEEEYLNYLNNNDIEIS